MLCHRIGQVIEAYSYEFRPGHETDFADSLGGSWYVSPKAHGIELLTMAPFYLAMTVYFGHKAVIKNKQNYVLLTQRRHRPQQSWLEFMALVLLTLSISVTVVHKYASHTEFFLLQPCHMSAFMLVIIMAWPNKSSLLIPALLFNIYLHTLWGAVLALVFPDLRDHEMLGEVFNFFLEHGLILVLPFYLLTTKRHVVLPFSIDMALFSFFLYAAYHSPFLQIISLLSGYNLNYALVTPALGFLIAIGNWYRLVMFGAAFILMFLTRYIVELFLLFQKKQKKQ